MLINEQKTKEMIITSSQPHVLSTPQLLNIERVYNRANSRLHFFATAEKGSSPVWRHAIVLYCSYTSSYRIRSTCLAHWSHCWTGGESIESIQKCALRIIFGGNSFTISSYLSFCDSPTISSLYDRRDKLSTDYFTQNSLPVKLSPPPPQ